MFTHCMYISDSCWLFHFLFMLRNNSSDVDELYLFICMFLFSKVLLKLNIIFSILSGSILVDNVMSECIPALKELSRRNTAISKEKNIQSSANTLAASLTLVHVLSYCSARASMHNHY